MARLDAAYVCQSCGTVHAKWQGRCDGCGLWNTLVEEARAGPASAAPTARSKSGKLAFQDLGGSAEAPPRLSTGVAEFDRVCGGGVVRGSALLVGGDPGIGKSTLLLQAAAGAARGGVRAAYVSGEESAAQIQDRARRLGLADAPVRLAAETRLEAVIDGLKSEKPDLVIIDSIQTLWTDTLTAAPGSVGQVRACAHELTRFAKTRDAAIVLVGHVTKDGQIAGPRVVEHMVDAVLQFEGERGHEFRILRGLKNRFGATHEIGVFEMSDGGLREVANPSALFLDARGQRSSGTAVFAGVEGARPILIEIQALCAPAAYGTPRRAVVGWDSSRLAMVLAVLEQRCGLGFAGRDIYLNVAGGMRITEPAADLAVAAALASAIFDVAPPEDSVAFGEIALTGDVRAVNRAEARLGEAAKLGFSRALAPAGGPNGGGVAVTPIATVADLIAQFAPDGVEAGA